MKLSELLTLLVKEKGSDLHLKTGTPPRGRVDGHLHNLTPTPVDATTMMSLVSEVLNENQKKVLARNCDIDLIHLSGGNRFRVNAFRQDGSIAMVMRVIPTVIPSIDELGLPSILKDIALEHRGIILVTGTTGSGKSTTLASMINHINVERSCNIITIEDPVEFRHSDKNSLVTQRSVGVDVPSFEHALKYVLRQDPDIILIGEMRDKDTIRTAITASETGHLIFSTVHTTDAPQTIERIVSSFPQDEQEQIRIQLSTNIRAVVSQRLIKQKGGGRLAALEIMTSTPTIRKQIYENELNKLYGTIKESNSSGMQTFNQVLFRFVSDGLISSEDALAAANRPDELLLEMRMNDLC